MPINFTTGNAGPSTRATGLAAVAAVLSKNQVKNRLKNYFKNAPLHNRNRHLSSNKFTIVMGPQGGFYRLTKTGTKSSAKNENLRKLLAHLNKGKAPAVVAVHSPVPVPVPVPVPNVVPLGPHINAKNQIVIPSMNNVAARIKNHFKRATAKNNKNRSYLKNNKGRIFVLGTRGGIIRLTTTGKEVSASKNNKMKLIKHLNSMGGPSPTVSAIVSSAARNNNMRAKTVKNLVAGAINRVKQTELMNRLGPNRELLNKMNMKPRVMSGPRKVQSARF